MPPVSFLIKPASSECNLRCGYCFYFSEARRRSVRSYGMMSEQTLEAIVSKGLRYADGICAFAFQGGEPTIAGLPFFEKLIGFVEKYNVKNVPVSYAIQTNGILIDENWARFFHDHGFLVGLSLDGDGETHNLHRRDASGEGSFNRVMNAAKLLERHRADFNILSVVTSHSTRRAGRIYDFFKKNGFRYLQFIPCLDPLGEGSDTNPYSLKPGELGRFLKLLFDRWYADFSQNDYISVRYFDNLIQIMLGRRPEACSMNGICTANCVLEADGGMYPCDFYMVDEWRLGSILTDEIDAMLNGAVAKSFLQSSAQPDPSCAACRWRELCRGGCRREREGASPDGLGPNRFCADYRAFFDYAYPRLVQAARAVAGRLNSNQ